MYMCVQQSLLYVGVSSGSVLVIDLEVGGAGRKWGRGRGREAGREGGRQAGRQGGREGGRQAGRQAGRQGGREGESPLEMKPNYSLLFQTKRSLGDHPCHGRSISCLCSTLSPCPLLFTAAFDNSISCWEVGRVPGRPPTDKLDFQLVHQLKVFENTVLCMKVRMYTLICRELTTCAFVYDMFVRFRKSES